MKRVLFILIQIKGEPVPPWPPRLQRPWFLQIQKQSFKDDFQNQCSLKFRKFHKKTPVLESLVNKVTDRKAYNFIKKRLHHRCFPVKFAKLFIEYLFSQHTSGGCFCRSMYSYVDRYSCSYTRSQLEMCKKYCKHLKT